MTDKVELPVIWQGWSFQDEYLIDDAHNKYHINDVRSVFMQRQLHTSLLGKEFDIICLKQALEKKLKELESSIVIQLINNDTTVKELKFNL